MIYRIALLSLFFITALQAQETKTRVALAGDSTVTDKAGWGAAFAKLLGPQAECVNFASGGQSTKSFREGKTKQWQKVLDSKPAFVLIQFGHNDMPGKGEHRETDPATTYRENLIRCIDEARAIGAQPIIVTSVVRRLFIDGKIRGEVGPWAEAAKKVGEDKKVPVVNLFERSRALHNEMGQEKSDSFNPLGQDGKPSDHTHLNAHGAEVIAGIIAEEIRQVQPDLAKLLK
ncbi:MAG: rhamnogalacturonan acetylesterase [Verrucomicrobiota bacterium]